MTEQDGSELMLYSPHPPIAYTRPCQELGRVGIGAEMSYPGVRAQWNLYWLSDPALDHFLDGNDDWRYAPGIDLQVLASCYKCVKQRIGGDLVGELLLRVTPPEFFEHLRKGPHEHLEPFKLLGDAWLDTVDRRSKLYRGRTHESGSVVYASFGKRPTDAKIETIAIVSARIMTLELQKK